MKKNEWNSLVIIAGAVGMNVCISKRRIVYHEVSKIQNSVHFNSTCNLPVQSSHRSRPPMKS